MIDDIDGLRRIFHKTRSIAIIGLSPDWHRPSHFAAKYMLERGYRIIPVNPTQSEILGQVCYPNLEAIDEPVDMVDIFRKPVEVPALVDAAHAIACRTLWLQLGVIHPQAATHAEALGLQVVMDRCVKIEYARLFGGLHWAGVNTGIISAKRPLALR